MPEVDDRLGAEDDAERAEKKADYFIPQAMHRLDDSGEDVFEERPPLADGLLLPHYSIVTKPSQARIYQYCPASKLPIEIMCLACEAD